MTPLQTMHKAEKKYEVGKVTDKEEAKQRQLKAILNKLMPENFEKLFEQVKALIIDNAVTLIGVVSQIFEKALMEPTFCEMYANLFSGLASALPDFGEDNEKITFKRVLLNECQEELKRGEREQEEANCVDEGEVMPSAEEREEKRIKAKRCMLGYIRLIGELYKKKMLTQVMMLECLVKLMHQWPDPDEEDVEALYDFMSTFGEMKQVQLHMILCKIMMKNPNGLGKKWLRKWKLGRAAFQKRQLQTSTMGLGPGSNASGRRVQGLTVSQNASPNEVWPEERLQDMSIATIKEFYMSITTASGRRVEGLAVSQSAFFKEVWEKRLQDMSIATIKEFYSAVDEKEVTLRVKEMNSRSFHPTMVSLWIADSFERNPDRDVDLLAKLLVSLTKSQDGTLNQDELIKGFELVLATLEDTVIDAPRAREFLGRIFAIVVTENVVSLEEIERLKHEGGEEPGLLLEAGLAADVLGSTLEGEPQNESTY